MKRTRSKTKAVSSTQSTSISSCAKDVSISSDVDHDSLIRLSLRRRRPATYNTSDWVLASSNPEPATHQSTTPIPKNRKKITSNSKSADTADDCVQKPSTADDSVESTENCSSKPVDQSNESESSKTSVSQADDSVGSTESCSSKPFDQNNESESSKKSVSQSLTISRPVFQVRTITKQLGPDGVFVSACQVCTLVRKKHPELENVNLGYFHRCPMFRKHFENGRRKPRVTEGPLTTPRSDLIECGDPMLCEVEGCKSKRIFKNSYSLLGHVQTTHKNHPSFEELSANIRKQVTARPLFQCHFCPMKLSYISSLNLHIKLTHKDKYPEFRKQKEESKQKERELEVKCLSLLKKTETEILTSARLKTKEIDDGFVRWEGIKKDLIDKLQNSNSNWSRRMFKEYGLGFDFRKLDKRRRYAIGEIPAMQPQTYATKLEITDFLVPLERFTAPKHSIKVCAVAGCPNSSNSTSRVMEKNSLGIFSDIETTDPIDPLIGQDADQPEDCAADGVDSMLTPNDCPKALQDHYVGMRERSVFFPFPDIHSCYKLYRTWCNLVGVDTGATRLMVCSRHFVDGGRFLRETGIAEAQRFKEFSITKSKIPDTIPVVNDSSISGVSETPDCSNGNAVCNAADSSMDSSRLVAPMNAGADGSEASNSSPEKLGGFVSSSENKMPSTKVLVRAPAVADDQCQTGATPNFARTTVIVVTEKKKHRDVLLPLLRFCFPIEHIPIEKDTCRKQMEALQSVLTGANDKDMTRLCADLARHVKALGRKCLVSTCGYKYIDSGEQRMIHHYTGGTVAVEIAKGIPWLPTLLYRIFFKLTRSCKSDYVIGCVGVCEKHFAYNPFVTLGLPILNLDRTEREVLRLCYEMLPPEIFNLIWDSKILLTKELAEEMSNMVLTHRDPISLRHRLLYSTGTESTPTVAAPYSTLKCAPILSSSQTLLEFPNSVERIVTVDYVESPVRRPKMLNDRPSYVQRLLQRKERQREVRQKEADKTCQNEGEPRQNECEPRHKDREARQKEREARRRAKIEALGKKGKYLLSLLDEALGLEGDDASDISHESNESEPPKPITKVFDRSGRCYRVDNNGEPFKQLCFDAVVAGVLPQQHSSAGENVLYAADQMEAYPNLDSLTGEIYAEDCSNNISKETYAFRSESQTLMNPLDYGCKLTVSLPKLRAKKLPVNERTKFLQKLSTRAFDSSMLRKDIPFACSRDGVVKANLNRLKPAKDSNDDSSHFNIHSYSKSTFSKRKPKIAQPRKAVFVRAPIISQLEKSAAVGPSADRVVQELAGAEVIRKRRPINSALQYKQAFKNLEKPITSRDSATVAVPSAKTKLADLTTRKRCSSARPGGEIGSFSGTTIVVKKRKTAEQLPIRVSQRSVTKTSSAQVEQSSPNIDEPVMNAIKVEEDTEFSATNSKFDLSYNLLNFDVKAEPKLEYDC